MIAKSVYVMLCGMPGSGKSTARSFLRKMYGINYIASSDDIIERECKTAGITYHEGFSKYIGHAQTKLKQDMSSALADEINILDDATNLTKHGRFNKLRIIPSKYLVICYYFPTPEENEWRARLDSRPGKIIPENVLQNMKGNFVMPSIEEKFDMVFTVNGMKK